MTTFHFGKILEVSELTAGSEVTQAYSAGATVLSLYDTGDFDFVGGVGDVEIESSTYPVVVDTELDTLTLGTGGLLVNIDVDTKVISLPYEYEKEAIIEVDELDDALKVRVPHTLYDAIPEGVRDPGEEESVQIYSDNDEWVIHDIFNDRISRDPGFATGGAAPGSSPLPSVVGGIGALYISYDPVIDASGVFMNIYIDDAPGAVFAPANLVKTVSGTVSTLTEDADGNLLDPAKTYYIVVEAFNGTDTAPPSAEVEGQLRLIDTPDISVAAAWVGTMVVDRLIGGYMSAEAVLAGDGGLVARGADGREVSMRPDGFQVVGPTSLGNPVYIDFPTDGGPNIIAGTLKATTLEVAGDPTTLKGATFFRKSVLEQGAELRMGVGILEPPDAPGVSHWWPSTPISGPTEWVPGVYDGGNYYFLDKQLTNHNRLRQITPAGVVTTERTIAAPGAAGLPWTVLGVIKSGTNWIILEYCWQATVASSATIQLRRFNSSWTETHRVTVLNAAGISSHTLYSTVMGLVGTDVMVASPRTSDGLFDWWKYSGAALAAGATGTLPTLTLPDGELPMNIVQGSLGATGTDFYLMSSVKAYWFSGGTTPSAYSAGINDFILPSGASGTVWDGTRMWTITSDATSSSKIRKHALAHANLKHWAAATKYNASGPRETTVSPKYGWTPVQRKFFKYTMSYPGATGARVYTATGASEPADSAFELTGTVADPIITVDSDSLSTITGAAPPTTNNYASGSPAKIKATTGLFSIDGDSNGDIGEGTFRESARGIKGNNQTANYTPTVDDKYKIIQMNSSSNLTLTVPAGVFANNDWFEIYHRNTGTVTIVPAVGVTLNARGLSGNASSVGTNGRHSMIRVWCRAADTFVASGDIGAVS